jgi:signal peptidase I
MTFAELRRQVTSLLTVVAVCTVARASLADHYLVPSESMEPTVHPGDRILVDKAVYGLRLPFTESYFLRFRDPLPGEVVVLDSPGDKIVLLKRVVAGPGDVISVRSGRLELNGHEVGLQVRDGQLYEQLGTKPHPLGLDDGGGPAFGPVRIPEGKFLVLGDNRGNSRDGRFFGLVDRGAILGRADVVYWRAGWFDFQSL